MFNDTEKEELRRIVNKFVEQGRCARPIHPDQVLQEVKGFKQVGADEEQAASTEVLLGLPSDPRVESLVESGEPTPS